MTRLLSRLPIIALALAGLVLAPLPASADPIEDPIYPIERGIVTLVTQQNGYPQALQETNEEYFTTDAARIVVASPLSSSVPQQKWRLVQHGLKTYRLINVVTGRALQRTDDSNGLGATNLAATPADWNSTAQYWTFVPFNGRPGSDVLIYGRGVRASEGLLRVNSAIYRYSKVTWTQAGTGTLTSDALPWTIAGMYFE